MKKHLSTILVVIVFLTGLGFILYPTIADWWNEHIYEHAMVEYDKAVQNMGKNEIDKLKKEARAYNQKLAKTTGNRFRELTKEEKSEYYRQLSLEGESISSMLGQIEIPTLQQRFPIYHGTDDETLSSGIGHLEGTSLPIGGKSSHCILSGHRGLPSSELFSDLDKIVRGDIFYLHVLDETLCYEVDQIKVVLPEEIKDLQIVKDQDLCTLITCTPYGVNSHRLLVRGHRVDYPGEREYVEQMSFGKNDIYILAILLSVILFIVILVIYFKRKKKLQKEINPEKSMKNEEKK